MFSLFRRNKKKPPEIQLATITNGPGTYLVEAVGESKYQDTLEKICGGRTENGHRYKVDAYLYPEDDNPHDNQAILIVIDDEPVGYLDRATARSFRKAMAKIAPNGTIAKCPGMIVGGWDRGDGDEGYFGVRLDLPSDP
ncbi:hypothetical protein HBA54_17180 [Pelagibius litoralis]|uniref:HIRAN domain-containing protein n=1 Tax=Pelagibius litoralis TaxID=374515 RepID=A0A967EZL0_9PROT|nr:hypothetical protein [Pelagibius litoralis]NIA70342.1 hypothetical protein [Pelagibius litoralis]